ncbi:MAG: type II secretion system protein [Verrucomicrobia bacterium]|nr:type II secretion system protein [Verrucomicrobiota bacterium]
MNHPFQPATKGQRGFLLLEVILALAVFSAAATGFTVALHRMASSASLAQSELRITRILNSALDETLSLPVLEEGTTSAPVGKSDMEMATDIRLLEGLENEDGEVLQEMYLITVTARWFESGAWKERSAETWRYGRMYQP